MKKIYLLLLPFLGFAQSEKNPCETLTKINTIIQSQHYKPKVVDDSLSVYVFKTFLEELDEDNRLFTEIEVNNLKKHQLKIDNYLVENNCDFLKEIYTVYNTAIERYKTSIETIRKEPFAFSSTETIEFSVKSFPYAKDEKDLKRLFKKRILFHVLRDISEVSKNKDSLLANFDAISKTSKDKIFESYSCKYSGLQLTKNDFNSKFFNAFCSYFDPHTMYLSKSDKSSFLSNVSADNLSFGLNISMNEKDEITVDEVVPGSSAYFSDKIDSGDQIIKVKYLDNEYTIACSSMQKIEEIFTSSEYRNVDFTFRKKTGEVYTVSLTKKVMKDYDNNVYSYILEKDNKKTGYIRIPSFYAKFENGKSNVSDDVAKEIYKLQKDNIDGLIIDLENNGGGSMDEAVQLTGSLIDIGPIAIMNTKSEKKQTIKDPNRGSIYNGPLVVLINGFSASASEFFANTMQDYKRAIVIGNQSHGKASMQRILPLALETNQEEFIKLTIEEFYRVTGKTNQTIGITPDVFVPTLFDKQMPRESKNKTALKNDTIEGVLRFTEFPNPKRNEAIEKSKIRVNANQNLKTIATLNEKLNKIYDEDLPPILLNFNSVFESVIKMNALWKEVKDLSEKEYDLKVERNSVDVEYQQFDEYLKSSNTEKIKAIKSNLHIIEAVHIINDLKN
ncbi:S41 family peptidase [Flavobacterium sp.]|uniref:S41 family peptidase n=1 Tax=Flavobacterium sp. TaxID=239 RepID=UPI00263964F3|nr:S41 family peptidase [Flavobacterium sp.]